MFQHVPTALWEGTSAMIWVKLLLNICRKHSDKFMMLESDQAQGLIPDVVSLDAYLERCGHLGWPQAYSWYSNVFYAFPQQISSRFCYVCGSKCFCLSRGFRPRYPSRKRLVAVLGWFWQSKPLLIHRDREVHSIPPRPLSINLWGDKNRVALIIAPLDVGSGLAADLLVIISQKVSNIFFILPNFLGPSLVIVSYITLFPVVPNRSSAPKMSQVSPQQPKKAGFLPDKLSFT